MGAVIEIPIEKLPEALDSLEREARRAVARGALAGAHRGRALIVKRTPVDLGPLKAGWTVKPGAEDFADGGTTLATLTNHAPHIVMVELGSRPHRMSPAGWAALYEWVRRHFRGGKLGGDGRMKRPRKNSIVGIAPYRGDDPEISAITNAIVARIAKRGTKPTFFVKNSLHDLQKVMISEVERAIREAAERAHS